MRAAEVIAACTGDVRRVGPADALAAAGLAPVLRQSGTLSGRRRACGGDKARKRVFCQSAFRAVAIGAPLSRAFYDRKRREGTHHTRALVALARRRATVLRALLHTCDACDPMRKVA